ncbi:MAG: MliC family protein [Nitrospira sp.]|nr:MliC family protein [Nitrospira sp.]
MKSTIAPAFASVLLISSCSNAPQEQASTQPVPSTAASVQTSAPTTYSYRCESGETVNATYPSTDAAIIQYKGQSHEMLIAISGSGSRYIGGGLEWWTKGSGAGASGALFRHQEDGTSGETVETCAES